MCFIFNQNLIGKSSLNNSNLNLNFGHNIITIYNIFFYYPGFKLCLLSKTKLDDFIFLRKFRFGCLVEY